MSIKEILKNLDNGILPDALNYSININHDTIDISKLQYNAFYRSYDFYACKYPKGMVENLPGFDKVLDYIVELNKDTTPLKELEERNEERNEEILDEITEIKIISHIDK